MYEILDWYSFKEMLQDICNFVEALLAIQCSIKELNGDKKFNGLRFF
jgi:hypothetical protein